MKKILLFLLLTSSIFAWQKIWYQSTTDDDEPFFYKENVKNGILVIKDENVFLYFKEKTFTNKIEKVKINGTVFELETNSSRSGFIKKESLKELIELLNTQKTFWEFEKVKFKVDKFNLELAIKNTK